MSLDAWASRDARDSTGMVSDGGKCIAQVAFAVLPRPAGLVMSGQGGQSIWTLPASRCESEGPGFSGLSGEARHQVLRIVLPTANAHTDEPVQPCTS